MTRLHDVPIYSPGLGDGQPRDIIPGIGYTLPGSGISVPAGLEAVLDYRGLLMNIRENIDRYKITTMDGLYDADIRDTRDVNTEDDGETPYNAYYGGRTIVISGTIETHSVSKLRDMQQALKSAFIDITREYPLHFRTGDFTKDHVIWCKKIGPINGTEQQTGSRFARDFQVSLRASNPRFLSYYRHAIDNSSLPIPATNYLAFTPVNLGNFRSETVFRIYGPSTNATFVNDVDGISFTVGAIDPFDYVEFDTAKRTMKNSMGQNVWNKLADGSEYLELHPGNNPIYYTGDSPRVQIYWFDSWM